LKASAPKLPPELGAAAASLLPASFQVLLMGIDASWSRRLAPRRRPARLIFTRSGGHLSKLGMIRAEVMDGEYSTGIHG
jgi:hypothetical protein